MDMKENARVVILLMNFDTTRLDLKELKKIEAEER